MFELPTDACTLAMLVFALGARHGLDADHLAAIDGLTRFNAGSHPRLARSCGRPVGIKGRWLGKLLFSSHPAMVALVGALFAASFDTISQAALFAIAGVRLGGWHNTLMLGLLFMLGMLITDGLDGYFIYRLLARTDRSALTASRIMGLCISALSLLVAALGVARIAIPALDQWSDHNGLMFTSVLIAVVLLSFAIALRRPAPHPAETMTAD